MGTLWTRTRCAKLNPAPPCALHEAANCARCHTAVPQRRQEYSAHQGHRM